MVLNSLVLVFAQSSVTIPIECLFTGVSANVPVSTRFWIALSRGVVGDGDAFGLDTLHLASSSV